MGTCQVTDGAHETRSNSSDGSGKKEQNNNNNNNNNNIYLLQLGCYPVAVVILHVNKT